MFEKIDMPDVKNVITVASGKGGVGKSTIAANLAMFLAKKGFKTALVDADIYGPSAPKMFGLENSKPEVTEFSGKQLVIPIEKYGVKVISVGFFVDKKQGLIWRGPMVSNTVSQLFDNTLWEETDYMIVDFPPGTGDIQLTTIQKVDVKGTIMVTTPQDMALADARKAASMFANPGLNIPVIGVVENMSWFTPAPHPEERYYIFGKDGGKKLATELNVPVIAQIPLISEMGEAAEKGIDVTLLDNPVINKSYSDMIKVLVE